jgi:hypothetical protein
MGKYLFLIMVIYCCTGCKLKPEYEYQSKLKDSLNLEVLALNGEYNTKEKYGRHTFSDKHQYHSISVENKNNDGIRLVVAYKRNLLEEKILIDSIPPHAKISVDFASTVDSAAIVWSKFISGIAPDNSISGANISWQKSYQVNSDSLGMFYFSEYQKYYIK